MADIVTGTVTGQVDNSQLLQDHAAIRQEAERIGSDIRMEQAQQSADVRRDQAEIGASAAYQNGAQHAGIVDAVKTAGWANSDRTGTEADRIVAQDTAYFIAGQSQSFSNATALAALKSSTDANFNQTLAAIQLANERGVAAAQLSGEKTAAAAALGQAMIGQQIVADGNATRALINGQHIDTMNRMLAERQNEIVEQRQGFHYWQGQYNNSQQANLVSQVNALNSQFQETRQGMVNFGTMAGVGQTSTSNNVR